jgi:hypothetical protein
MALYLNNLKFPSPKHAWESRRSQPNVETGKNCGRFWLREAGGFLEGIVRTEIIDIKMMNIFK